MLPRLLLLLTIAPLAELAILLATNHAIAARWGARTGLVVTIGSLLLSGLLGTVLARRQGIRTVQRLRETLARGEFPGQELVDAALIVVGGALLIVPGYLSDLIGLVFLIPWSRHRCRSALQAWLRRKIDRGEAAFHAQQVQIGPPEDRGEVVIDVTPRDDPGATQEPRP
jgi:UPF0716 protein FxsA